MSTDFIRTLRDLDRYGFNVLTGEADKLMFRQLVDVDEVGKKVLCQALGLEDVKLYPSWNSKTPAGRLAVGCFMLAPEDTLAISIYALFQHGCHTVAHIYKAHGRTCCELQGLTEREAIELVVGWNAYNEGKPDDQQYRFRTYKNPGREIGSDRNQHQMSGRVT